MPIDRLSIFTWREDEEQEKLVFLIILFKYLTAQVSGFVSPML